jgi:uncharacterized protein (TIGR00369 family)
MTNPYGNMHGGMMSLVIDEVIGWAVVTLGMEQYYTTLNLNVNFLYGIQEGSQLKAQGRVVRAGKKIIHAECRVYDLNENLLATASSNLVITNMRFKN